MGFIDKYPYTDFHELNLDWIIARIKELSNEYESFKALNTITYKGDWDITKQYPAWSVVADPVSHDGYLSLKAVPAGIDISNGDYWFLIYSYNSDLSTLDARVTALEGTVSNLSGRMTTAEGNITSLGNRLTAAESDIKAIRDWSQRSVLFIGDSYLTGYNGSTNVKTYADYINDYLNFKNYYKSAISGCGFGTSVGNYYLTAIENWLTGKSTAVKNSITDVFILGGYNDKDSSVDDIATGTYGINNTVAYIRANLPNAQITIGFLGRALYTPVAMTFAKMQRTVKAYRKGAIQQGAHYLEGSELCLHDYTLFSSDNIHPTSEGYNQLGDYLTCLLLGKDFDYMYTDSSFGGLNVDFTGSSFSALPTSIYQGITRNAVTLDSYGGQHTFTTPIASWQAAYSNEILIGNFKTGAQKNYFMPKYTVYMQVPVSIQHSGGVSNVNGVLAFTPDGDLKIAINALQSGSWNFETFTSVSKIMIGKGTVNIPIEYC